MSRLIVAKVGGNIFKSDVLHAVAADIGALCKRGDRVVMVHGGGPQATAMQETLGLTPNIVGGRRVTDAETLRVMKMVVGGQLNIDLCAALLGAGASPVGLHGASSMAVRATRRPPRVVSGGGPEPVDFGLVGDVTGVNRKLLRLLVDGGFVPVLACLGASDDGTVLNINADVVANHVAAEFTADALVLVTGAPGVLRDKDDPATRIPTMTVAQAKAAIADGTVVGGMIPKLEESIRQISVGNVGAFHIVGNVSRGDLLRELDEPGTIGTALLP